MLQRRCKLATWVELQIKHSDVLMYHIVKCVGGKFECCRRWKKANNISTLLTNSLGRQQQYWNS